jgi:hypothetical protein
MEIDLDNLRNVRVCLWVSSNVDLVKDHHACDLELRPPFYFIKEVGVPIRLVPGGPLNRH